MNLTLLLQFDTSCNVHFIGPESAVEQLEKDQKLILETALLETASLIKQESPSFFKSLVKRRIQLRLCNDFQGAGKLMPHDILLNADLLRPEKRRLMNRHWLLVGVLERVFFHLCNPELHITEVRLHSLRFLQAHKDIRAATLFEMRASAPAYDEPDWYETLKPADNLILLDEFWHWLAKTDVSLEMFLAAKGSKARLRPKI